MAGKKEIIRTSKAGNFVATSAPRNSARTVEKDRPKRGNPMTLDAASLSAYRMTSKRVHAKKGK
jgi:hypothetical protein